jgi:cysteinyl-tRNA synthetase
VSLRLYDTATREVRDFEPLVPGEVSLYHCGLTVQSAPHVGHIRAEVVYDVLRRWLTARGLRVTSIVNVTDIDDKILAKSAELGVPWWAHAYHFERELHRAYAALGCLPPSYEPRATGHIPEMLELIAILLERGHAYVAEDGSGDIYFDVRSWPAYGSLSRQKIEDMEPAGDADPRGKRDPRDFALWKGHKASEPASASWPTPWGRGRPGWHLECSAMAWKYLGEEFDIHGGGLDLRFPHHENELAQSTAAGQRFARFWMHNAWVTAAGEKMSKSLGNGALVSEVVQRYPARAVRFYLAQPHYRSAIEFSDTSLDEATAALARIDNFVDRAVDLVGRPEEVSIPDAFAAAMDDDLGTPGAVAVLYQAVRDGNTALTAGDKDVVEERLAEVLGMLGVLGLDAADPIWQTANAGSGEGQLTAVVDGLVGALLEQRAAARARKDFATADALRDSLTALGITVTDTPQGPRWSLTSSTGPHGSTTGN